MTFDQIAEHLNISAERARQIYHGAIGKLQEINAEDLEMLQEEIRMLEESNMHDWMTDQLFEQETSLEDDLGDFWKEKNNY